jgi:hypothetical protein
MSKVSSPEPFCDAQRFALRMSVEVQPASVIETSRDYDKRVGLPVTDRVPQPHGVGIFGQCASIGEDRSEDFIGPVASVNNHGHVRDLDDLLVNSAEGIQGRKPSRQATRHRALLAEIQQPLSKDRSRPGCNLVWREILRDVPGEPVDVAKPGTIDVPQSGEIRLAIRHSRRRRRKIRFAVRQSRDSRRDVAWPLAGSRPCKNADECQRHDHQNWMSSHQVLLLGSTLWPCRRGNAMDWM